MLAIFGNCVILSRMQKVPTLEEKVFILNMFVHSLSIYKDSEVKIKKLIQNADSYSRACDRIGSATGLDKEIDVAKAFWKLCDTD